MLLLQLVGQLQSLAFAAKFAFAAQAVGSNLQIRLELAANKTNKRAPASKAGEANTKRRKHCTAPHSTQLSSARSKSLTGQPGDRLAAQTSVYASPSLSLSPIASLLAHLSLAGVCLLQSALVSSIAAKAKHDDIRGGKQHLQRDSRLQAADLPSSGLASQTESIANKLSRPKLKLKTPTSKPQLRGSISRSIWPKSASLWRKIVHFYPNCRHQTSPPPPKRTLRCSPVRYLKAHANAQLSANSLSWGEVFKL